LEISLAQSNIFENELGDLSKQKLFHNSIDLKNLPIAQVIKLYEKMYLIRTVEELIASLAKENKVKTPVHLGIGQEAIASGISLHLQNTDRVYSSHRGHAHYLASGGSVEALIAEILGKATGAAGGMGGSMHLSARDKGFHGSVPIVGATIPIAVGAALASKLDEDKSVSLAYFGDGACEEGVLHESLNLSKIMNLPMIFVCENNLFSSHLDVQVRQPSNKMARFANAHKVPSITCDGNDPVGIFYVAEKAINNAREGRGPFFIEAVTYRWKGHVGPNDDIDVGVRRNIEELTDWKKRDPLKRLSKSIFEFGIHKNQLDEIKKTIDRRISKALDLAMRADEPQLSKLLETVYDND
jgi:TPP-dependent pyruvate/acetoin dehydrogenase alpha subunit